MQTVKKAVLLQPSFTRIYPALVVENSGLAEMYKKGDYIPLTLNKAIVLAAWAKKKLEMAGIRVVRIGLQPSGSLESSLIAGPYHPSMGELVSSREWLNRVKKLLAQYPGEKILFTISHRDLSSFNGLKRSNLEKFQMLGLAERMEVVVDKELNRGSLLHVVC